MAEEFGKYRLIKKIAQGGMAEVFLATQSAAVPGFEKQIAIKRIFPNLATDENMRTMFLDEATIAARLNHPNIVQIYDVGEVEQYLFLAMEFVDGYDFRNVLVKAQQKGVSVPYPLAVNVIMNAAAGLHHAHALVASDGTPIKVIHRDMSPQNILISKGGNVKVCDFGVAKAEVRTGMTRAGELKGKISYMSPEQIEGSVEIDARSDIFSLGVVLYEATTMTRLFRQGTDYEKMRNILDGNIRPPSEVTPGYPKDLEVIVLKCLANNRDERYQTAKELQVALDGWLSRTGVSQSALELERFLAFLFEDMPINPSSQPGDSSAAFASEVSLSRRGSNSRVSGRSQLNLERPVRNSALELDKSGTVVPDEQHDALKYIPTGKDDFLSQLAERREKQREKIIEKSNESFSVSKRFRGTGTHSGIDYNTSGLPKISARLAPPTSSYGTPLPGLYNTNSSSRAGYVSSTADRDDEPDDFDLSDSSIEQEIPTAEYQVIGRHQQPSEQATAGEKPYVSNRDHLLIAPEGGMDDVPEHLAAASPMSNEIQRGAPPRKRNTVHSSLDIGDSSVRNSLAAEAANLESSQVSRRRSTNMSLNNMDNVAAQAYTEPWEEKKSDGGILPIVFIVLVIGGLAGAFIYLLSTGYFSAEAEDNPAALAVDAEQEKLDERFEVTKLRAFEPNVQWTVNGRIPNSAEGNDVALLKGKPNFVTAYKVGFFPGSGTVSSGAADAPRIKMDVDKSAPDGALKVTTEPAGASVYVDGTARGGSPSDVAKLSTKFPHHVVVKADGYADYVGYILVNGPDDTLNVTLKKGTPTQTDVLVNIAPDGSVVQLNGADITVPTSQQVKSGSFVELTQQAPQFFPFAYVVDTTNVGTLEFKFPLVADERPRGTLTLNVEPPGTKIFLGDQIVKGEAIQARPVLAGHLPVVLEGPKGRAKIDLDIRPDRDNAYQLALQGTEIVIKKRPYYQPKSEETDGDDGSGSGSKSGSKKKGSKTLSIDDILE